MKSLVRPALWILNTRRAPIHSTWTPGSRSDAGTSLCNCSSVPADVLHQRCAWMCRGATRQGSLCVQRRLCQSNCSFGCQAAVNRSLRVYTHRVEVVPACVRNIAIHVPGSLSITESVNRTRSRLTAKTVTLFDEPAFLEILNTAEWKKGESVLCVCVYTGSRAGVIRRAGPQRNCL